METSLGSSDFSSKQEGTAIICQSIDDISEFLIVLITKILTFPSEMF